MRSHPPALFKVVARSLREESDVSACCRLLVAVSGGADSMALLHVCSVLRERFSFEMFACGVDHGLRAAAKEELSLAGDFAERLGVPFTVRSVQVAPGGNLHARAREQRYAALEEQRAALDCDYVVTAHHAQDRAETVLIRLLSGSGPKGLAVLPVQSGALLRPMIRAQRAQVRAHVERHQIPFREDPSNGDRRFLRARVRHEVLPLLESISPGIIAHLNSLADEMTEAAIPVVVDESGEPVPLRRSHRNQLRRALRHQQRHARVLIGGGRIVTFDPRTGQPTLSMAPAGEHTDRSSTPNLRPPALKKPKCD